VATVLLFIEKYKIGEKMFDDEDDKTIYKVVLNQ
jgi:hypothetical protein